MRRARQRKTLRDQRRRALLAGAAGAVLLTPAAAEAADFTVTNTADAGAGSLRQAVSMANGAAGADRILFSGAGASGTIRLTTGVITINGTDPLTIVGPGRDQLSVSGDTVLNGTPDAGDTRIFDISMTDGTDPVDISGLTLTNGFNSVSGGGAVRLTSGQLSLTDAAVTNSKDTDGDGGGGIFAGGDVTLTRSRLTGNVATNGPGGAVVGNRDLDAVSTTVSGNSARGGGGFAVDYQGVLTIKDGTITDNHATDDTPGGGVYTIAGGVRIERSTVTDNTAAAGGGVAGYTAKYGSGIFNSTVTGNTATSIGGGAFLVPIKYEAKISESTVGGNHAPLGAGLIVSSALPAATATIERSTIKNNSTSGAPATGGGVLVFPTAGAVRMLDSTVTGNTADHGAGVSVGGTSSPTLKYNDDGKQTGSIDLDNSTIAGNTGGGVYLTSYDSESMPTTRRAGTIGLSSTIVSGNTGGDTDRADDATAGGINAAFSLIQAPGDAPLTSTSVITGKDPLLGGLGDNGGPTQTMLPAGTSPALDQGRSGSKNTTDQRGQARLVDTALPNPGGGGDGTDIGAVELPANAVVIPPPPPPPAAPSFSVSVGATAITAGTPLLPASLTPLTCAVTIVKLTGCDVAIRADKPIKLSKKVTVPAGTLLAEAQPSSAEGAATLSSKAVLTADGRAVLKRFPVGVDARANGVGTYSGSNALTTAGKVHLLAGPSVTFKLGKGTKLSKTVKTQLGQLGKLLTGAKTVSVSATGPSKKKAAKQAKAAGKALTAGGLKATPTTAGKKSKKRRLKVTFTL